jgi:large subunit ribosomal protein L26e
MLYVILTCILFIYPTEVSSSRRKSRAKHYALHKEARAQVMSAPLSKELRRKYNVRSMPIRKDDEVSIVRGIMKKDGKVTNVSRATYRINVERVNIDKTNGDTKPVAIHPSNVVITKLYMDPGREKLLAKRKGGKKISFSQANSGLD